MTDYRIRLNIGWFGGDYERVYGAHNYSIDDGILNFLREDGTVMASFKNFVGVYEL